MYLSILTADADEVGDTREIRVIRDKVKMGHHVLTILDNQPEPLRRRLSGTILRIDE